MCKMFLKYFCFILFFSSTCFVDAGLSRCPDVHIQHGRIRYSGNRARRMRISCFAPYTLIGSSRFKCENGEWNGPMPVCASKNCEALPKLLHGKITYFNDKAIAKMQCNPDFTLIGSSQMHCTGSFGWNDTVIPECRANSIQQFGICRFEPNDTKHCEWVSKNGLFNWTIMSSSPEDNTHIPNGSIPSHDHTSRVSNSSGHFLYLEALVAPTKMFLSYMDTKNATAKYISPLFPPFDEDEPHCLIFYLYANGSHAGIVEVFINQDSIWKSNGSLGTEWKKINIPLLNRSTQFRITIEGKGELGHFTSTAIDDLRIAVGEECEENHQIGVSANADVEQSVTKSFTGIEEYDDEDEAQKSPEVHANHSSFSTQSPKSKFENTSTTSTTAKNQLNLTAGNSTNSTTDNRTGSNTHMTDNENMPDDNNNSFIKVEDSNSTTETIISENNVIFHKSVENKNNDDDKTLAEVAAEHEIHMNSTHDHENDNDLRINIPPTNLSSNESEIKEDNQEFDRDMTILQHQFSNKTEKILSNVSAASTSYVVPMSNDPVVEPNDAENEDDHQEENSGDEVEEKKDDSRHFENEKNVLQKSNDENKEIKYYYVVHADNDHSNGSGIFWIVISIISGVMFLFFVLIYKKYYRNRRKDTSSIQFLAKDDGCSDSFRTKDDVLILNCVFNT